MPFCLCKETADYRTLFINIIILKYNANSVENVIISLNLRKNNARVITVQIILVNKQLPKAHVANELKRILHGESHAFKYEILN